MRERCRAEIDRAGGVDRVAARAEIDRSAEQVQARRVYIQRDAAGGRGDALNVRVGEVAEHGKVIRAGGSKLQRVGAAFAIQRIAGVQRGWRRLKISSPVVPDRVWLAAVSVIVAIFFSLCICLRGRRSRACLCAESGAQAATCGTAIDAQRKTRGPCCKTDAVCNRRAQHGSKGSGPSGGGPTKAQSSSARNFCRLLTETNGNIAAV